MIIGRENKEKLFSRRFFEKKQDEKLSTGNFLRENERRKFSGKFFVKKQAIFGVKVGKKFFSMKVMNFLWPSSRGKKRKKKFSEQYLGRKRRKNYLGNFFKREREGKIFWEIFRGKT